MIAGAIESSQRNLWIGDGILRALESGTAATHGGLGMTLGATVAVERWAEAGTAFVGHRAGNRIHFHEGLHALRKHGLFGRVERGIEVAGVGAASAGTGIGLRAESGSAEREEKRERHYQRNTFCAIHLGPPRGKQTHIC